MLKIMYGFLRDDLMINDLRNKSYLQHAIINVKTINCMANGCVFAALIDDELDTYCDTCEPLHTTALTNLIFQVPLIRKPYRSRLDITDPIAAKKYRQKCIRRLNNLSINKQNWLQFAGSKNMITSSVLATVICTNGSEHAAI